jgi:hypothetical protein
MDEYHRKVRSIEDAKWMIAERIEKSRSKAKERLLMMLGPWDDCRNN